jgi:hypothetical protein
MKCIGTHYRGDLDVVAGTGTSTEPGILKVKAEFLAMEDEMFNSLEDELKRDEQRESTPMPRWFLYLTVLLASVILFAGLYVGIRFLE